MLAQKVQINARLDVKALHVRHRDEVGEVAVAFLILAQQHEMAGLVVEFMLLVKARARGDVHLAADDGLDALGLAGAVKVDRTVHHAVVGDGAGGLSHRLDELWKVADAARAVEQAVFGMDM